MKKRSPPPVPLIVLAQHSNENSKLIDIVSSDEDLAVVSPVITFDSKSTFEGEKLIEVDRVLASPYQNRIFNKKSDIFIADLASNIEKDDLNSPILVRLLTSGDYELIAGENRLRAYKNNGQTLIPAFIKQFDDVHAAKATVLDNIFHSPLSALECYRGYKILLDMKAYISQAQLAKDVNLSPMEMSRLFCFGKLSTEAIDLIAENPHLVGSNTASDLAKYSDQYPALVTAAVRKIMNEEISQGRAIGWIRSMINPKTKIDGRTITDGSGIAIYTLKVNKSGSLEIKGNNKIISPDIQDKIFKLLENESENM